MKIVCSLNKNVVQIEACNQDGVTVATSKCERDVFCEKIAMMFASVVAQAKAILSKQNDKSCCLGLGECEFCVEFEEQKNITTARIFKSFCVGITIDGLCLC